MVDFVRSKLKILKIVLWSILGAILLFVLIVVGTLLVEKYIKKSPVPMFAGYASMIVVTGSMSSTINQGDLIIIKQTNDYKTTDIVTFITSTGEIVTHRLVFYIEEEGKFITMGDGNNGAEDPDHIAPEDIIGKVVLTIPMVGLFFEWVLYDYGIIYIIAILAVIVAGIFLWNLINPDPEPNAESSEATVENSAGPNEDNTQNNDN